MDNNMEAEKPQKQQIAILEVDRDGISAPNWLFEVLAWISRIEMANSQLSFSCKLFKQICWPKLHENVKPRKIKKLEFHGDWRNNSGYLLRNPSGQPLPIPNPNEQPSYIIGCKRIDIFFLNDQMLEILKNILPRLNQMRFSVEMHFNGWAPQEYRTYAIWCLLDLLAHKIVKFKLHKYYGTVSEFNRLFPGFIQKANFLCACPIADQFDILFNWLALPPTNGEKQKILELKRSNENDTDKFVRRIKKEFSNAKKRLNFFIICPIAFVVHHFNMWNKKTGEILSIYLYTYRVEGMQQIYNLIVRCPNGEQNYWNEEGQKKMRESWDDENENATDIVL